MEPVKSITSKHITDIIFLSWLGKEEEPSNDIWRDLDLILNTDVFKPLIRVYVGCVYRDNNYRWRNVDNFEISEFPSLLPNVYKKGILAY